MRNDGNNVVLWNFQYMYSDKAEGNFITSMERTCIHKMPSDRL